MRLPAAAPSADFCPTTTRSTSAFPTHGTAAGRHGRCRIRGSATAARSCSASTACQGVQAVRLPALARPRFVLDGRTSRARLTIDQMKRFKAVVIGGTGYGGAELIRRLLIHPEVELVRVVAVDHVGEPLGAVHPPLTGRSAAALRERAARGGGARLRRRAAGPAAQGERAPRARDPVAAGAKVVDMSGDFRLRDAAAYAALLRRARTRTRSCWARFVYGLPELNRDGHPDGARGRVARLLRDDDRARPAAAGARGQAGGRQRARRRHDRLVGQRRRADGRHAPPGARGEPEDRTRCSSTSTRRRSWRRWRRRARRASSCGFVPVSAPLSRGILATSFVELPADDDRRVRRRAVRRRVRARAVRALRARSACPRWRRSRAATTPRSASRWARRRRHGPTRTLAIVSATDNLIKGGAGQAIQSMNLMLGLPETTSLEDPGPWP